MVPTSWLTPTASCRYHSILAGGGHEASTRRPSWPHIWGRRWSRHSAAPSRRRPKRGCPQHNVTGTSVESSRRPGRVEGGGAAARCRARVSCWSTMSRPPGPRSRRAPACCVAAAWAKCGRSRWRESFAETSPTGEIVTLRVRARIGSRFGASYSYRVRPEPGARREHTGSSRPRVFEAQRRPSRDGSAAEHGKLFLRGPFTRVLVALEMSSPSVAGL